MIKSNLDNSLRYVSSGNGSQNEDLTLKNKDHKVETLAKFVSPEKEKKTL